MLTLGLSGHYGYDEADCAPGIPRWYMRDAAACLIADGELVAAVEQERLNRIKHTSKVPVAAIRACLDLAGRSRWTGSATSGSSSATPR